MAAPVIGIRPRIVPPRGAVVDRSHQLAQGLVFCFLPAHGLTDLAVGYQGTVGGSPALSRTTFGQSGQELSSTSDYYSFAGVPDAPFLGPLSVLWVGRQFTYGANYRLSLAKHASNAGTQAPIDTYSINGSFTFARANTANVSFSAAAGSLTADTDTVLIVSAPNDIYASTPDMWINGSKRTLTRGGTSSGAATGSGSALRIGRRPDGVVQNDGATTIVAFWSRQLNLAEAAALYADPFCFLRY